MAVTRAMAEDKPVPVPWNQIRHAVFTMMMHDAEQKVKVVKGEGWSVYRTGKIIRIDIQQGE